MATNQAISLNIDNLVFTSGTVISSSEVTFNVECSNLGTEPQEVECPISSNHRDIQSVLSVSYPYNTLLLSGFDTTINLNAVQEHNISTNVIYDQPYHLNVNADWQFNGNTLTAHTVTSSKVDNYNAFPMTLGEEACLSLDIKDTIYRLNLNYDAMTTVNTGPSGVDLTAIARNITNNQGLGTNYFSKSLVIETNFIVSNITRIVPVECTLQGGGTTAPPASPPPGVELGVSRYGLVINPNTGLKTLGQFGFTADQVNAIFRYNYIDKFNDLVIGSQCFKIKIWIPIPLGFIWIVVPLWIDVDIVTTITDTLASTLEQATTLLETAVTTAIDARNQVNAQNIVAAGSRAVAVGRLVATGQANQILINAGKNYLDKQRERVEGARNITQLSSIIPNARQIIVKGEALIESLSAMQPVLDALNNEQTTSRGLLTLIVTANNAIDFALQEFVTFLERAPDNKVKEIALDIVREIIEYLDLLDRLAELKSKTVDRNNPVEVVIGVLDVLINVPAIKKFFNIAKKLNLVNIAYQLLVDELANNEAIQTVRELDEAAAAQEKTQAEVVAEALALEAATAVEGLANDVANLLQLNRLENLAKEGVAQAFSGVRTATAAIANAADDIENKKREKINERITSQYLGNVDLYKIGRIGRFDVNHPNETQLLVNDLGGTRIYAQNGTELYSRADFCNLPFMRFASRLNDGGCQADRDPCGVGGFDCQELNYWYSAFKYRVSFNFYNNHDLSVAGVVIGNFDGIGGDDIWCHYRPNTKNYDISTANHIVFSPLLTAQSNYRIGYNFTLPIPGWCSDGVIKVGDFNNDNKDDVLCITNSNFYLLYSTGVSFRPASEHDDGRITSGGSVVTTQTKFHSKVRSFKAQTTDVSSWTKDSNIVVGDFDGDGYADLVKITATGIDALYGNAEGIFIKRASETSAWSSTFASNLATCNTAGINRIIVADTNNDGKDDITCISVSGTSTTVNSTIPSATNVEPEGGKIRIFVEDVNLYPVSGDLNVKRSVRVSDQVANNKISYADKVLITNNKMLPEQRAVSDISLPIECLNSEKYQTEGYFILSTRYNVPEKILWNYGSKYNSRTVDIEVSAEFRRSDLTDLTSSPIQSFEFKLEAVKGGCYKTEAVTNFVSLSIGYNATAKMIIERDDLVLSGTTLEKEAAKILPSFTAIDGEVSFPVEGHLTVNLLGIGYDIVNDCN